MVEKVKAKIADIGIWDDRCKQVIFNTGEFVCAE